MSELSQYLNNRGIRPTAVRILVLRALQQQQQSAVSMADLEEVLQTVDRSSVFRTLNLFLEHHVVHQVEDGTGQTKYALCEEKCRCGAHHEHQLSDFHVHFYCEHCRRTICLPDIAIPNVAMPEGFTLSAANFVLKGTCAACQSRVAQSENKFD